ncbi:hypothetical protein QBC43DRAFT_334720 [Cladorrhinum sp. PSN259]|nr:hypothetical protein QBC43DRAFT_334720 [Cladorrhinum sp. PSN259]
MSASFLHCPYVSISPLSSLSSFALLYFVPALHPHPPAVILRARCQARFFVFGTYPRLAHHPRAACPVHVRPSPLSERYLTAYLHQQLPLIARLPKNDPSVAQLPLILAIRSARSPPRAVSIASATLHASRGVTGTGMNGDHNSGGGAALEGASKKANAFVSLTSPYTNPFPSTTTTSATNNAMSLSFKPAMQPYRATHVNSLSLMPLTLSASPPSTTPCLSSALVRNLPHNMSGEQLSLMLAFSNDLIHVEILPVEASDDASRTALLKFRTPGGALEVKNGLDGKKIVSDSAGLSVEVLGSGSPTAMNGIATPTGPVGAPTAPSSRQTSRFNGTFQTLDKITTAHGSNGDLSTPIDGRADYASLFSTQSPIGNHIAGNRGSSKKLIDATHDEETDMLLHDPVSYAENSLQRRQTAPQIPITRMNGLSLNTNPTTPGGSMAHYGHSGMNGFSGLPGTMSPTVMNPNGVYNVHQQQQHHHNNNNMRGPPQPFPPVNPADQHPPCNTLYVGNLPIDTSEEELKQLFCRQRGYKRLCFRTKANGPMCFVEFEDVSFATRALTDLYGTCLQNSSKGGIRLSFSKNPLGVRAPQPPAQGMPGMGNGFTTASGPPPGLVAPPPGLGANRVAYTSSPGAGTSSNFSSPTYSNAQYATYSTPAFQSPTSTFNNVWGNGFMYSSALPSHTTNFQQHMMHQRS